MKRINFRYSITLILAVMLSVGCGSSISLFDQYAYTQVTSIKVDALSLMNDASEPYAKHAKEAKSLSLQMQKMVEYETHRPKNAITARMWVLMIDPDQHLYGGFINRWRQKGRLDSAFIANQRYLIGRAFDQIAELESKKIKASQTSN